MLAEQTELAAWVVRLTTRDISAEEITGSSPARTVELVIHRLKFSGWSLSIGSY
jgi:hypothetical protein